MQALITVKALKCMARYQHSTLLRGHMDDDDNDDDDNMTHQDRFAFSLASCKKIAMVSIPSIDVFDLTTAAANRQSFDC